MKKLLLASAIAALSVSAANAAPTIYGKAFLILDAGNIDEDSSTVTSTTPTGGTTVQNTDNSSNSDDSIKLNSKSSRIGFKGSEALTADTDVVYKLEYQIDVDGDDSSTTGYDDTYKLVKKLDDEGNVIDAELIRDEHKKMKTARVFKQRDTYLGLANKQYGTVLAGHLTTIDDNVDFADVLEGNNVALDAAPSFDEPRAANAFAYVSPDYDGMQVLAMYALDEENDNDDPAYGIAATYAMNDAMNIGASYIDDGADSHIRVSGNYAINPAITLGALYQNSDYDTDDNENAIMVSGTMKTATPWSYYAQVNMVDNVLGNADDEALGVGIGGKYKFTKAATGHLYAGYVDGETINAVTTTDGANTVVTTSTTDRSGFGIGAGLEYKF